MVRYTSFANFSRWIIRRVFVVRPVVISRKLNKIDPQLLRNTVRKLATLILSPRSNRPQPSLWEDILVSNTKYVQI